VTLLLLLRPQQFNPRHQPAAFRYERRPLPEPDDITDDDLFALAVTLLLST
jgi:hypothetical protein